MAKYILYISLLLFLVSCGSRKKIITEKEVIVEKVITTTKDTSIDIPARSLDTTLPVSVLLPDVPGVEKKTVVKQNGITAKITAKDSALHIAIDAESLKLELKGYIKEQITQQSTTNTTTKEKERSRMSIFTALGLALFIAILIWLINKFL